MVLENGDENVLIDLPSVVLETMNKGYEFVYIDDDKKIEVDESGLKNGRYNVMFIFLNSIYFYLSFFCVCLFPIPVFLKSIYLSTCKFSLQI